MNDVVALEKLIEASICGNENEAIAYKLLANYGSADQAIRRLDRQSSEAMGIDPKLVSVFSAIHQLNLAALFRRMSGEPFPDSKSSILAFLNERFPNRQTYVVQFFYFCGCRFVGSSEPITGTINDVVIQKRAILSGALKKNASTILPVLGLPEGITTINKNFEFQLDCLSTASEILGITTDHPVYM